MLVDDRNLRKRFGRREEEKIGLMKYMMIL